MQLSLFTNVNAKPILKWAGGKTQLLNDINNNFPEQIKTGEIKRYVEAFVGGGAVFFHVAKMNYVSEYILADLNHELILLYKTAQSFVDELINELSKIEEEYLSRSEIDREKYFYEQRDSFNKTLHQINFAQFHEDWVTRAAQIIFLNRTCFNGLFRVNSKGLFNVPFGKYTNPKIFDSENLRAVACVLENAIILSGDFSSVAPYVDNSTFVYFDPPYRPISKTASFNSYAKDSFDDREQRRLAEFYKTLNEKGAKLMLSNSDPKNVDPNDNFFDEVYKGFTIKRVKATRLINSKAEKRGEINELLIMNYTENGAH